MDYSNVKGGRLNDSFSGKNEMNDDQSTVLLKTNANQMNFNSLINQQAVKSWLPLPHPCIFASNWSSSAFQFNLFKQYPFFCLNSNATPPMNVMDSDVRIHQFGTVTKEAKSSNSHCVDDSEDNEVVSNNSELTAKDGDKSITENEAEDQNTPLLTSSNHKEGNNFLPKKFTTRETTNFLKSWLNEHRHNPYPTKNEKVMLALTTKMSLTQISTWFANARRRLKKENQMTWAPKIRHHRISIHSSVNGSNTHGGGRINRRYDYHSSQRFSNNSNSLSRFKSTPQTDFLTNQINSSSIYQSHEDNTSLLRRQLILDQLLRNNKQQQPQELYSSQFNDNLKRTSNILSINSNFTEIIPVLGHVSVKGTSNNHNVDSPADEADDDETRIHVSDEIRDNDEHILLDDKSNSQDTPRIPANRPTDDDDDGAIPCSTASSLSSSPTSAKNASDRNLQMNISKIWSVADVID
ncbi:unnamed protein product [Trichobilharzia szidati]|nr:unnamed protein product [Trichobilharzia szidati]